MHFEDLDMFVCPRMLEDLMASLAQYLQWSLSMARSTGPQAVETFGLFEAARDTREKLKHVGLSMEE